MGKRTCIVPACGRPNNAYGLCFRHRQVERAHGTESAMRHVIRPNGRDGRARVPEPVENPATGCLIWQGAVRPDGRGQWSEGGRSRLAHRMAYERAKGPIPDGLTLDHLCLNPLCINPDHLEPVTRAENTRRQGESRRKAA